MPAYFAFVYLILVPVLPQATWQYHGKWHALALRDLMPSILITFLLLITSLIVAVRLAPVTKMCLKRKARALKVCYRCNYDLRGNPDGPCPECGYDGGAGTH